MSHGQSDGRVTPGAHREQDGRQDLGRAAAAVEDGADILREVCDHALDELGSTVPPTQLRALLIVQRLRSLNLNTLAQEMRASTSATSRLCDRLQTSGLIVREAAARDRREVVISLSQAGDRLVGWAREQRRTELAKIIETMSPGGREALVRGLADFRSAVEGLT